MGKEQHRHGVRTSPAVRPWRLLLESQPMVAYRTHAGGASEPDYSRDSRAPRCSDCSIAVRARNMKCARLLCIVCTRPHGRDVWAASKFASALLLRERLPPPHLVEHRALEDRLRAQPALCRALRTAQSEGQRTDGGPSPIRSSGERGQPCGFGSSASLLSSCSSSMFSTRSRTTPTPSNGKSWSTYGRRLSVTT